jgi:uncharacterized repeat protein (TIGR01451 family)
MPSYCLQRCNLPGESCKEVECERCGLNCGAGYVYCSEVDNNVVDIYQKINSWVQLGEQFCLELIVHARADSEDVVVKTSIPDGAVFEQSDPPSQRVDNELIWRFDSLCRGERRSLKIWFEAAEEGATMSCSSVHATPMICSQTHIGHPVLSIQKDGPEVVVEGDHFCYEIIVCNEGPFPAYDVVVRDELPRGVCHASGEDELIWCIGTLCPDECRCIRIPVSAVEPVKEVCNVAYASSSNADDVSDRSCLDILDMELNVSKRGTESLFIGKEATYTIVVKNDGENELTDVRIIDHAPDGTWITDAPEASWDCDHAEWHIASLLPGEMRTFTINMTRDCTGYTTNYVYVTTCEGAEAEACFETEWLGMAALSLDLRDICDPIVEGDSTCYTLRVYNTGTAADSNIQLTARFSDELKPVDIDGFSQGEIAGQAVMFEPVNFLDPMEYVEYTIYVEGVKAGNGRVRVDLRSDKLKEPITAEESTHVL